MTKQETVGGAERRGAWGRAAYNLVSEQELQADFKRGNAVQTGKKRRGSRAKLKIGELGHRFVQDCAVKKQGRTIERWLRSGVENKMRNSCVMAEMDDCSVGMCRTSTAVKSHAHMHAKF